MSFVTAARLTSRLKRLRRAARKVSRFYVHGEERYFVTWDDFVEPSSWPLDPGPFEYRLYRPDDAPRLAAFSHLPRSRLNAWVGPGHILALALRDGEAIGYYSFVERAPLRVRRAFDMRRDDVFAVEIFTVPAFRRQGVTRQFRIAMARLLRERGFRGTWGLQDPLNYPAADVVDRLPPALTRRTGTLTRRCFFGRVAFSFDPAAPLSPARIAPAMEPLREMIGGGRRRITIVLNPGSVILPPGAIEQTVATVKAMDVDLAVVAVRESQKQEQAFAHALDQLERDRPDGIIVLHDPMFLQHRHTIVRRLGTIRAPVIYESAAFAAAGGLLACPAPKAVVPPEIRARSTAGAGGERLVVNLATARALGLALPPAILGRASVIA